MATSSTLAVQTACCVEAPPPFFPRAPDWLQIAGKKKEWVKLQCRSQYSDHFFSGSGDFDSFINLSIRCKGTPRCNRSEKFIPPGGKMRGPVSVCVTGEKGPCQPMVSRGVTTSDWVRGRWTEKRDYGVVSDQATLHNITSQRNRDYSGMWCCAVWDQTAEEGHSGGRYFVRRKWEEEYMWTLARKNLQAPQYQKPPKI